MHAKFVNLIQQWWIKQSGQNEGLTFIVMIMAWMSSEHSSIVDKKRESNNSGFCMQEEFMNVE